MSDPCIFQDVIMKNVAETAELKQEMRGVVDKLEKAVVRLDALLDKLSVLSGEVRWQKTLVIGISLGVSSMVALGVAIGKTAFSFLTMAIK